LLIWYTWHEITKLRFVFLQIFNFKKIDLEALAKLIFSPIEIKNNITICFYYFLFFIILKKCIFQSF